MKPHPLVISILKKLCSIIPTWKMIPAKDMIDIAIKDPEKRQEVIQHTRVIRFFWISIYACLSSHLLFGFCRFDQIRTTTEEIFV